MRLSHTLVSHVGDATRLCVLSGMLCASCLAQDGWWRDAVFYEVFVRSFADSTHGPLAGDGVGDLRGLIERLDFLNDGDPSTTTDLGVTALWLMPICQSPSYHGYDIVDYRTIDEEYGTNQDFLDLVDAAHARGMRVIVDMVLNHSSRRHPWFVEALDAEALRHDWYIWSDEPREVDWGSTVWHKPAGEDSSSNSMYYFGLFSPRMPDLNLRNPATTQAVHELSRFWLTEMRADGFRLDAAKHLIEEWPSVENTDETIAWLVDYKRMMKTANPDAFLIGEVWSDSSEVARYFPDALDAAFDFDLAYAIVEGVRDGDAGRITRTIKAVQDTAPLGRYATFLANHDMQRVMTTLREGAADDAEALTKAKLCATIQLTLPGIPFVYYGEEIGITGTKPDPDLRTPMQWTDDAVNAGFTTGSPWREPHANTATTNVRAQTADPASLLSTYRRLVRLRHEYREVWRGSFELLHASNPAVLAYMFESPTIRMVVIANCSGTGVVGVQLSREELVGEVALPWASLPAWGSAVITTPR